MANHPQLNPEELEKTRAQLKNLFHAYVEGSLPASLWVPAERLLDHLGNDLAPEAEAPRGLDFAVRQALGRLHQDRSRLPMAAASTAAVPLELVGEQVGLAYGLAVDVDGGGELVQVEVQSIESRDAARGQTQIHTYGPLARVVAIDGGIVADSQFTDSIRRLERLLEKLFPHKELHVECEVAYCEGADPTRRRPIEGGSLSGAILLAILSRLHSLPISRQLAASFTVRSDGSIGGVERIVEKARIAHSQGIVEFLVSEQNREELDPQERSRLPRDLIFLSHVDELLPPEERQPQHNQTGQMEGFQRNLRQRRELEGKLRGRGIPGIQILSGPSEGETIWLDSE